MADSKTIKQEGVEETQLYDEVLSIRRVAKVVTGGKNLRFSVFVAVGDKNGRVGIGKGKAREVPIAIAKAVERAKRNMIKIPIVGTTIPHEVFVKFGASKVLIKPASEGTGVIAGSSVRKILELAGVKDVLAKVIGSRNPITVAYATMEALKQLLDPYELAKMRGKEVEEVWPRSRRKYLKSP